MGFAVGGARPLRTATGDSIRVPFGRGDRGDVVRIDAGRPRAAGRDMPGFAMGPCVGGGGFVGFAVVGGGGFAASAGGGGGTGACGAPPPLAEATRTDFALDDAPRY